MWSARVCWGVPRTCGDRDSNMSVEDPDNALELSFKSTLLIVDGAHGGFAVKSKATNKT